MEPSGSEIPSREIAARAFQAAPDGRSVSYQLRRLESSGLVERARGTLALWRTTELGRDIEVLCSTYDARRGGEFLHLSAFIDDFRIRHALLNKGREVLYALRDLEREKEKA